MTDLDAAVGDARFEVLRPAAPTSAELDDLLPQLTVDGSAIRCAAVNRLSRSVDAPFVVEPLIALLKDDDRRVRRAAMSALAESGDARAIAPLRAVMKGSGSLPEEAGRALGQLERRLAGRGGDARNPDARQAIQTAREIRKAIAARKLRLRSEVRKGVRLKLVSLPLWGAGVALFGIGVVGGAALAIVAGIAIGALGLCDDEIRRPLHAGPRGCGSMRPAAIPTSARAGRSESRLVVDSTAAAAGSTADLGAARNRRAL